MSIRIKRGLGKPSINKLEERQLGIDYNNGKVYLKNKNKIVDVSGITDHSYTNESNIAIGALQVGQEIPAGITLDQFIELIVKGNITPSPIEAESISINENITVLQEGHQQQLTVTFQPENTTNKGIIWESSDTSKATIDTNGLVTTLHAGTVTLTAKYILDETISDSINITVEPTEPETTKDRIYYTGTYNNSIILNDDNFLDYEEYDSIPTEPQEFELSKFEFWEGDQGTARIYIPSSWNISKFELFSSDIFQVGIVSNTFIITEITFKGNSYKKYLDKMTGENKGKSKYRFTFQGD
jgi:hypothetical protein